MPTKAQLVQDIAAALAAKDVVRVDSGDIEAAITGAAQNDKIALRKAVRERNHGVIGLVVDRLVFAALDSRAAFEAGQMLSDDSLSLTELSRWLD